MNPVLGLKLSLRFSLCTLTSKAWNSCSCISLAHISASSSSSCARTLQHWPWAGHCPPVWPGVSSARFSQAAKWDTELPKWSSECPWKLGCPCYFVITDMWNHGKQQIPSRWGKRGARRGLGFALMCQGVFKHQAKIWGNLLYTELNYVKKEIWPQNCLVLRWL